ncbi:MAG: YchJ family protein [Lentisphaeria bacterium]|nr:YchJ family protein [Lentisphaeria bacterium]
MEEDKCPCLSGKTYAECCEGIIRGTKKAATAEELMRARYSAYAKAEVDFIINSTHSSQRESNDRDEIRRWAEKSVWKGIEILRTEKGGENDETGIVEFIARYADNGVDMEHHEISEFVREKGEWTFLDGKMAAQAPYVRESAKVGRNDPCPCGSGKKYKKCCGR